MKLYLAARYTRIDELRSYRKELEARGIEVTSRWLDGNFRTLDTEGTVPRQVAGWDMQDIVKADALVAFTENPRISDSRGGRHVEFGFAIALNKRLIVIGPRENVFYSLESVDQYDDWADFRSAQWGGVGEARPNWRHEGGGE